MKKLNRMRMESKWSQNNFRKDLLPSLQKDKAKTLTLLNSSKTPVLIQQRNEKEAFLVTTMMYVLRGTLQLHVKLANWPIQFRIAYTDPSNGE